MTLKSGPYVRTGADCAGVVADCANVKQHDSLAAAPGDAVFGLARGSLGSHVVADAAALARLPPAAELAQASTAPTVFTTAHLALYEARRDCTGGRCDQCRAPAAAVSSAVA